MNIRQLKMDDAQFMLEWMHDESINVNFRPGLSQKTLSDCECFIRDSWSDENNIHKAIVSDTDEYMGTVSLKNIDRQEGTAEFAIVIRNAAMSKGYAWFGLSKIMEIAFDEYQLESVYWCVYRKNERAIKFYDKNHLHENVDIPSKISDRYKDAEDLKWYSVLKGDNINICEEVAGCKVVNITTIPTLNAGELSFFEGTHDVPFDIKRIYYISKVPEGVRRGFHAHKELKQLLFCPYGAIQLLLDNGEKREEIVLSDPSVAVMIEKPTWREMVWLQKDSVLCVAASDFYKVEDYIRDYTEFEEYLLNR